jgi:hypothetical protein
MSKYDKKAGHLQEMVRDHEFSSEQEYDAAQVRQAVVHGREDIVLIVSHLSTANNQLASIRRLLIILIVLITMLILK